MTDGIKYATLENCSFQQLYQCFTGAFGDYQVPLDMSVEQLHQMLLRNSFDAKLSAGAFYEGRLVGFICNGVRVHMGQKLAYDSGTGVLPTFRRRGIASSILEFLIATLRRSGISGYVLECIKANQKALSLYEKVGFRTTREFDCWRAEKQTLLEKTQETDQLYLFSEGVPGELADIRGILSSTPSWQNSDESIRAAAYHLRFIKLTDTDGKVAGFASWDPRAGNIARLAATDAPAGSMLLHHIARGSDTQHIRMVNVDTKDRFLPAMLEEAGFTVFTSQVEMFKPLQEGR